MTIHTDDAVDLWAEVDRAMIHTKDRLTEWDPIQKQWVGGTAFSKDMDREDHENVAFGFGAWVLANLLNGQPRVEINSTREPGVAKAVEMATNRWIHQTKLRIRLEQSALDHTLMWGVGCVTNGEDPVLGKKAPRGYKIGGGKVKKPGSALGTEPEREDSETPSWPTFQRIPQERYFRDPVALDVHLATFEGHKWIRPRYELLEEADRDPTWHKDVIQDYQTPEQLQDDVARRTREIPSRDEVEGYQIWVKDWVLPDSPGPEKGYHGTIFNIATFPRSPKDATDQIQAHLRDPVPFYGPPWGPYVHFGIYPISNEAFPLSPVVAVKQTVDRLNRVDGAMAQGAEDFKIPIIYDLKDAKVASEVKAAMHGQLVGIPNFNKENILMGQPIGGISDQQIVWRNDTRQLVDRVLGFTDMQRGMAAQNKTSATEISIAAGNADVRAGYIDQKWDDAVTVLLTTVAWYIAMDDSVFVPMEGKQATQMGVPAGEDVYYQGGDIEPQDWARMDLVIEPFSMRRTDEGMRQQRAQAMATMFMQLPPLIMQFPMMPWTEFVRWYGDMMNMPDLEKLVPPETVQQLAQLGMMQMHMQMQPQGTGSSPRMGTDIGATGGGKAPPQPKAPTIQGSTSGNSAASSAGVAQ
ncbi:MAG: hypothetical protein V3W06_09190 [Acidimicrobiia bacterium]